MDDVFWEFLDKFVVCYLDNILIYSNIPKEHEENIRLVLQKLQDVGLYAKLEKCVIYQLKVEFLRYIISNKEILMDPKKAQVKMEWATSKIVRDVQCFLGFANFY